MIHPLRTADCSGVRVRLVDALVASLFCIVLGQAPPLAHAQEVASAAEAPEPVSQVGPGRLPVPSPVPSREVLLPFYSNMRWEVAHPEVSRALIILHGAKRNAADYFASGQKALAAAGGDAAHTILLAPQFLVDEDIQARGVGKDVLRWKGGDWMGGLPAIDPAPVSSFSALDAMLRHLADPALFPALTVVVIAGHSGGGQVVQRYAVVGTGAAVLEARGIAVRYVVANPSSYVYFSPQRPLPPGNACPSFNRWKYGFDGGVPGYVSMGSGELEQRYVQRDVIYLLGTADVDPHHPVLDTSCAAETQGAFRYARGINYFHMLQARDGSTLKHRLLEVEGVAHDGDRMFTSACGLAALFDRPGCEAREAP